MCMYVYIYIYILCVLYYRFGTSAPSGASQ